MTTRLCSMFAVLLTLLPACGPDPLLSGSTCCACLMSTAPDGSLIDTSQQGDLDDNCLAASGSLSRQNNTCSNEISLFIVEGEGRVETSSPSCVDTACAAECSDIIAMGLEVGDGSTE